MKRNEAVMRLFEMSFMASTIGLEVDSVALVKDGATEEERKRVSKLKPGKKECECIRVAVENTALAAIYVLQEMGEDDSVLDVLQELYGAILEDLMEGRSGIGAVAKEVHDG